MNSAIVMGVERRMEVECNSVGGEGGTQKQVNATNRTSIVAFDLARVRGSANDCWRNGSREGRLTEQYIRDRLRCRLVRFNPTNRTCNKLSSLIEHSIAHQLLVSRNVHCKFC